MMFSLYDAGTYFERYRTFYAVKNAIYLSISLDVRKYEERNCSWKILCFMKSNEKKIKER